MRWGPLVLIVAWERTGSLGGLSEKVEEACQLLRIPAGGNKLLGCSL